MKTIMSKCGHFFSSNDDGYSVSKEYGEFFSCERSIKNILEEAISLCPDYEWKIVNIKVEI